MTGNLIVVLWIAWLSALIVVAVLRCLSVGSERQQRAEHRQAREARPRHTVARQAVSIDYRSQLRAAGLIRPAAEPDSIPDPEIGM